MSGDAPLIGLPGDPPFASARAEWFEGVGGARLRAAWFSAQNPKGSVVLSTGRTEFIEKYWETIGELNARGFTVLAHDWRGQGLSQRLDADRLKGCADGFDDMVADYRLLLDAFENRLPKPWIALSHSMGGCLTLTALAKGEGRFAGCFLSAPMLGLKAARNPLAHVLAAVMVGLGLGRRYVGTRALDPFVGDFESNYLTHDAARYEHSHALLRACRDLALGGVTWSWVRSAFRAMGRLRRAPGVATLSLPVTVLTAQGEVLADNAVIETMTRKIPAARYREVPGAFHELLMEIDPVRALVWEEFEALVVRALG